MNVPGPSSASVGDETLKATPVTDTTEESAVERPVFGYEEANGRPLIVDHFEAAGLWQQMGLEAACHQIDSWILQQIETRQINPTADAYKSILAELRDAMDLDYNTRFDVQLEKMDAWVGMMRRLELKQQMKESLLGS